MLGQSGIMYVRSNHISSTNSFLWWFNFEKDHTEYATGEHTYKGQEGFYIITDSEEQSLGLPKGNYDVSLSLTAKVYDQDGQLVYGNNNHAGVWGDVIQVYVNPYQSSFFTNRIQ